MAVNLSLDSLHALGLGCASIGPGYGLGDNGGQGVDLVRRRHSGVFHVEAACLGVGKQAFDGPPVLIGAFIAALASELLVMTISHSPGWFFCRRSI